MSEVGSRWDSAMARALINDPEHWRDRAEDARRMAEDMADPEAKRMMLGIASGYDRLAEHAEQRLIAGTTTVAGTNAGTNKRTSP